MEPRIVPREPPDAEPAGGEGAGSDLQEPAEYEGPRWWCACGRSRTQPHCDGSHRGSGITPVRARLSEDVKLWCGAAPSKDQPASGGRVA